MTKKIKAPTAKKSTAAAKTPAAPKAAAAPKVARADKVGKTQLVERVAQQAGLSRKESEAAVSAMMEVMVDTTRGGQSLGLNGLGTFSVKATAARTGVRPGTSEKIEIPAGKKVAFKVASTLKGTL